MKLIVAIALINILAGVSHLIDPTTTLISNYIDGSLIFAGILLIVKLLEGDKK